MDGWVVGWIDGWVKKNTLRRGSSPFPRNHPEISCRDIVSWVFPGFASQMKGRRVVLVLENRGSAQRSEARVWGYNQGKPLTWRLNDRCCNIEVQPWEVVNINIKFLQHTLKLSLWEGNSALAIYQLGQRRRQDRE